MISKAISMLMAQSGVPTLTQQLTQLTGLPIADSWQGVIFLVIAIWAFLARRKGESMIVMTEQVHAKKLESEKTAQLTQAEQLAEAQRRNKELQDKLDSRSQTEIDQTNSENEALRQKLHDSRNENLKLLERSMAAEARISLIQRENEAQIKFMEMEMNRIRRGRAFFFKIVQDAAQDLRLNGLHEESEQIVGEISDVSDLSSPDIVALINKAK